MKFEILSAVWIQSHDSSPLQAGGWAAAKTRWYRPRRGRLRTEVYASFASEKVKKMPAVKNGFKIEIFNVPTSWSWRCSPITLLFSFLFGIAFQPSAWYNNGSITREAGSSVFMWTPRPDRTKKGWGECYVRDNAAHLHFEHLHPWPSRMLSTMGTLSLRLWSEFIDTVIFLSFAYGWIQMLREILIWHF